MQAEDEKVTAIEVTEILAPAIPVIRITNPFNPREFVREEFTWAGDKSLSEYFPLGVVHTVVSVNGKIVPAEAFPVTYLERGDNLVICPIPQGGDSGKGILSLVAMMAVAVFAGPVAGFLNEALGIGFAAGSTGMALLTAGVTMAGSMLVGSIFAPSKPSSDNSKEATSYGIDGAKNTSVEGAVVPICYGQFRMGGNIIDAYVDNDENDNQTLYVLICAGEGPIAGITDVLINDNPIADYQTPNTDPNSTTTGPCVEMQVRLGQPDQQPIGWFNDIIRPANVGVQLSTDYTYYTTAGIVDKLRLDLVAPSGLFKVDKGSGEAKEVSVPLAIEYTKTGEENWQPLAMQNQVVGKRNVTVSAAGGAYQADNGTWWVLEGGDTPVLANVTFTWSYEGGGVVNDDDLRYINANYTTDGVTPGDKYLKGSATATVPIYGTTMEMKSSKRSAIRRSAMSPLLDPGHYTVRVKRTTPASTDATVMDKVYLSDVNEISVDPIGYANTALIGLKIVLGQQISSMPSISFVNGGKIVRAFGKPITASNQEVWFDAASSNPAWVVWDMLTNTRYGGEMPTSRLDFFAFRRWAQYCDAQSLTWNGPIDTEMNVWDASQYVLRVGHAQLVNVGTRWTVVIEKPDTPVMMFTVANMIEGSYKETWLPMTDRANEVDVTYFDKDDKNKQRTIRVYDPAALTAGQKQRTSAVTLYGVDEYNHAYREGMFMMNLNRFIQKTIEFSAPLEAVACSVGDLIYVQHDMPNWAQAGRLEAGSTATVLKLDRPVTMEAGKTYQALYHHDVLPRYSGVITNIAGTVLFLSGYPSGALPVKRMMVAGRDIAVAETGDGMIAVNSSDLDGLEIGQPYALFDTDVIEERGVVLNAGDQTEITLQSPLSATPSQFGNWMFGETSKVKEIFRIRSVAGSHDYKRDITAIQYDERVYDYTRFAALSAPLPAPGSLAIGEVRNLQLYEETRIKGDAVITSVVAAWSGPEAGLYKGADVYVKVDDQANWQLFSSAVNAYSCEGPANRGQTVKVKVVAYDVFDTRAGFEGAPEASIKVVGELATTPGDVTGADLFWSGRDCRLSWNYNSTTHSYEFGSEPTADAGGLDPQFQDYEIRCFHAADAADATPRRIDHVSTNTYTYTYEKNLADGLERNLRFELRMRDKSGNLGNATHLTAYNPPPTLTGADISTTFESATVNLAHGADPDFAGTVIWLSDTSSDLSGDIYSSAMAAHQVYDGPDSSVLIPNLMFNKQYYLRIACYDVFGKTELLPSGVLGFHTTYLDVNAIADGVLAKSKLIPELAARIDVIDLVDGPVDMLGSVANQIATEAAARAAAVLVEKNDRTAALTTEANTRAQALLDEAAARGAAITTEQTARQAADSSLASSITTLTASVNSNAAAITTEQNARATADTSLASSITALTTTVNGNTAAIVTEQTTRSNADSALSSRIDVLTSNVGTNTASIASEQITRANADSALSSSITSLTASVNSNAAAITSEQTTRANADNALSSSITTLTASVNGNATAISTESTTRADADSALSSRIDVLTTSVNGNTASIVTEQTTRANADSALTTQINSLQSQVNSNVAAISSEASTRASADSSLSSQINAVQATANNNSALIATEQTARANADSSLSSQINVVSATAGNKNKIFMQSTAPTATADGDLWIDTSDSNKIKRWSTAGNAWTDASDGRVSATAAAVVTEQTARAAGDTANANSITSLSTTVSGHTTTISQQATSINGLQAQYTVKIDSNGYLAGYGLASYANNDGSHTSEFIVRADTFAIVMPSYASVYPFTVGAVNGVPRVIISSALIGDASINSAKIGNLEVATSNIATGACSACYVAESSGTSVTVTATVPSNCQAAVVQVLNSQVITAFSGDSTPDVWNSGALTINGSAATPGGDVYITPAAGTYTISATRGTPASGFSVGNLKVIVTIYKR
jgi:predicted phage tail protein